eukprot:108288-Prymnesium_polylepis.1
MDMGTDTDMVRGEGHIPRKRHAYPEMARGDARPEGRGGQERGKGGRGRRTGRRSGRVPVQAAPGAAAFVVAGCVSPAHAPAGCWERGRGRGSPRSARGGCGEHVDGGAPTVADGDAHGES